MSEAILTSKLIGDRIGITMTNEFINEVLKVKPDAQQKKSMLYSEDTFVKICDAFEGHVARCRAGKFAPVREVATRNRKTAAPAPAPVDDDDEI